MPIYCAVPMCKNFAHTPGVSFHRFPANEMKRRAWLIKIRRDESRCRKITKFSRVCSDHFRLSDFKINCLRKELKDEAEPTIYPFPTSHSDEPLCILPVKSSKKVETKGCVKWWPRKKRVNGPKPAKKPDNRPVILRKSLQEIALINNATVSTVNIGNKLTAAIICSAPEASENITNSMPASPTPTKVMLKFVPDVSSKKQKSFIPVFYVLPQKTAEN